MTLITPLFPNVLRCHVRTAAGNIHVALIFLYLLFAWIRHLASKPCSLNKVGRLWIRLLCRHVRILLYIYTNQHTTLCFIKTSPFYIFLWYLCQMSSDVPNCRQKHTRGIWNKTCAHMFVLYLIQYSNDFMAHNTAWSRLWTEVCTKTSSCQSNNYEVTLIVIRDGIGRKVPGHPPI